jgi:uracil-DNA glycosylase family 4
MNTLTQLIDETIAALEEMKRSGVTHVEVSRKTLEELGRFGVGPLPSAGAGQIGETPRGGTRPTTEAAPELARLESRARACVLCKELARCRANVVFGVGNPQAELMFIGEAPGADEDEQGEPFVGRAGQLLTKIIQAMGYRREDVYIANVLKCRPPENRTPQPDEVTNCLPYLISQIDLIKPKAIVALGATALRALLDVQIGITKMRGHWYTFREIPIMPTFHPAYLLRNPAAKKEVWDDMKAVLDKLGRELPKSQ